MTKLDLLKRYINADLKISIYVRAHIKGIPCKFCILNPKSFRVIYPLSLQNICLQTYRNNRIGKKLTYFLRKMQIVRVNNSIIFRIRKTKFSGNYFYIKKNKQGDFQINISVPLTKRRSQNLTYFYFGIGYTAY